MIIDSRKYSAEINENGSIISLKSSDKEFIKYPLPLFQFMLRKGSEIEIYSSDIAESTVTQCKKSIIAYYKFKTPDIGFKVQIDFKERIEFALSFENNTAKHIEWIDFPQIAVPNDLVKNGGSGRLALDINEGLLIEDLKAKETFGSYRYRDIEYPSSGLDFLFPAAVESQFLSYYDDNAGIYICAEDEERAIKGINFVPIGEDAVKLQFRLYPGIDSDVKDYTLPFRMVYDFYKGDWHDAAELYRNWFESNLPQGLKKVENNPTLPQWYSDSPLVVAYPVQGVHDMDEAKPNRLFPYNNALPHLDELAKKTNSRILATLMHWEGTAPWAPPYVWPPLGGEKMLRDFADKLHRRNFLLGLYCSGISYTVHSNINDYSCEKEIEKNNLIQYMCAPTDGSPPDSKTCQAQRKSYDMCISQDFTKKVIIDEAEKMISCGLDYIQILDQNHGGTPYLCYSDNHGHPAVPGKWMVEHNVEFLKELKKTVGNSVLLGCESAAAEAYIPYLGLSDNRFNLNYPAGKAIPLYGYIYHEYLHNFSGNSVCSLFFIDAEKSPDCHLLRVAHSFLAGDLMTVVINQDGEIMWSWGQREFSSLPEREPILEFIKTATTIRRGIGKKYLVYGRMVKLLNIKCAGVPMYNIKMKYDTKFPAVLTSAWESSDGAKAQFLASYRNNEEICTIDLTSTKGAKFLDEKGTVLKTLLPDICQIKIPPHTVRMLLFI